MGHLKCVREPKEKMTKKNKRGQTWWTDMNLMEDLEGRRHGKGLRAHVKSQLPKLSRPEGKKTL